MDRLLRVINKEWSGLHEAAFLLAGAALCSQLLGLVRDRLLAHYFGASSTLDIYYASFRVPDFLYASIASFVAVTVLIPFLLVQENNSEGKGRSREFINSVFTVFTLAMIVVCGAIYVMMPLLARYVVPGFSVEMREQFVLLSRVLLLSPFLLGISNLYGAITQSLRRFFVFAVGPLLYNLGIILGIVFFMPSLGLLGVVLGILIGAFLHLVVQLPVLATEGLIPSFTFRPNMATIRKVTALSIPRTLALSATHLSTMVLVAIASQIEQGAITVFMLAFNLQSIPLAIVGMSYSVAAFPTLTKLWHGGNHGAFFEQIVTATRHIIFWSFPAIVLFIVLRAQIVRTVLGSGAFDWTATRLTAALLALFAISVVAQNLVLLYTRTFYAMGKTKNVLYANVVGALLVVLFSVCLLYAFEHWQTFRYFAEEILRVTDIAGSAVLMLALGYSLGLIANLMLLGILLSRVFPELWSQVRVSFLHSFSASIVMGFVAYHSLQVFSKIFDLNSFVGIFFQGLLAGLAGICAGIYLLRLMDSLELREIRVSLHHKFWKAKPIVSEQEGL